MKYKKVLENTYLKLQIPKLWRQFFKNNADSGDYVYNSCNNPLNKFDRFCREWYLFKKKHNGSGNKIQIYMMS